MVNLNPQAAWFSPVQPVPHARMRLFCFPYAGASGSAFSRWAAKLPDYVEVCPVQLPGRASRHREPPFTRMQPLVESAGHFIRPLLDRPFAFFGHSMGAVIGFELARYLRRERQPTPFCLIASGRPAPQIPLSRRGTYEQPDRQFIQTLRRLNGTPREVLEHAEMMQMMLPILRADFELSETYTYTPQPPLNCAIIALGGADDTGVTRRHLEGWREQTSNLFTLHMFPGDHFFLHSEEPQLLATLNREFTRFF